MTYRSTTIVYLMPQHRKSRYQKQYGNATFGLIRLFFMAAWIGLVLSGKTEMANAAPLLVERPNVEQPNLKGEYAATEGVQGSVPVVYLIPDVSTAVQLQTHTADFRVIDGPESGGSGAVISYDGLYRLKNETDEISTVPLIFTSSSTDFQDSVPLNVSANGTPLALEAVDEGMRTQVQIAPDTSLDIRLDYTVPIEDAPLALLRYDARRLATWPGSPSLRTTIVLPEAIVPESWVSVEPADWSYTSAADVGQIGIQWLYDGNRPTAAFVLRFVTPDYWRLLDAEESATRSGAPAAFLQLGDTYRSLYLGLPTANNGDAEVKERYYAQALAAYAAGLERGAGAPAGEAGALHAGLASLYRSRVLTSGGAVVSEYASLMVQAATAALAAMPQGGAQHAELTQWQADGLRQLLADAQRRGDWPLVSALLDQMAALPEPSLSPDALAEERRAATILQALSLLESGQRDAAMALAGPVIVDAELQPASDLQHLFSSWRITATIKPVGIALDVQAQSTAERADAARIAFQQQIDGWRNLPSRSKASFHLEERNLSDGGSVFDLDIDLDGRESALTLAQAMAPGPDWVLLRALLEQMAPLVRIENRSFRRTITLEQSLDLRAAQAQWQAMADSLADQALAIEAGSGGINPDDPAGVEATLRARIRAANYRSASQAWRALDSNSWVTTRLTASDDGDGPTRAWLATASTAPETYLLQAETVRSTRLLWTAVALLAALLVMSSLLWRLL